MSDEPEVWEKLLPIKPGHPDFEIIFVDNRGRPIDPQPPSRLELIKLVNQMRAALVFWSAARFPEVPPIDPQRLGLAETTLHQMSKVPPIKLESPNG